jgi:hypothetical protein
MQDVITDTIAERSAAKMKAEVRRNLAGMSSMRIVGRLLTYSISRAEAFWD